MLYQLSYQPNWEVIVMWVDRKPVDDKYPLIQGSNPFQARIFFLSLLHKYKQANIKVNPFPAEGFPIDE